MKSKLLLTVLFSLFIVQWAWAQIPQTMSYQGVLTDASGNAVSGNRSLTFRFYEQAESGSSIWEETQDVVVTAGLFNIILGSSNPLNLPFDKPYWLGITIGQEDEMAPRIPLTAVPYSLNTVGGGTGAGDGHSLDAVDGDPTDVVFVDTEGKVGIGTTAPQATLHVTGTGASPLFQVSTGAAGSGKAGLAAVQEERLIMELNERGLRVVGEVNPFALFSLIFSGTDELALDALNISRRLPKSEELEDLFIVDSEGNLKTKSQILVLIGGESDPFLRVDPKAMVFQVGIAQGRKWTIDALGLNYSQDNTDVYNFGPNSALFDVPINLGDGLILKGGSVQFADGTVQSTAAAGGGTNIPGQPGEVVSFDQNGNPAGSPDFRFVEESPGNRELKLSVGFRFDVDGNQVAAIGDEDSEGNRISVLGQAVAEGDKAAEFVGPVHVVDGELKLWESLFKLELNPPPGGSNQDFQGTTGSSPEMLAMRTLRKTDGAAADQAAAVSVINRRSTGDGIFAAVNNVNNFSAAVDAFNFGPGPAVYGTISNTTSFSAALLGATTGLGPVLQVNHQGSSGDIAVFQSDFTNQARIDKTGKGFFNGGTQTGGADIAEAFEVEGFVASYEPGDVIAISTDSDRTVEKSSEPYSTLVIGVYATKPGVLLSERHIDDNHEDTIPVGIVGVIPTKVSAENGPIRRGDLLVASNTPGHAMKGTHQEQMFGATIGKALEEFEGTGTGVIRVLVNVK